MSGAGWFGSEAAIMNYLRVVNADKDENGCFKIQGSPPFVGMDGDVVIDDRCEYLVGGKAKNLAAGLRSTSQGMGLVVL